MTQPSRIKLNITAQKQCVTAGCRDTFPWSSKRKYCDKCRKIRGGMDPTVKAKMVRCPICEQDGDFDMKWCTDAKIFMCAWCHEHTSLKRKARVKSVTIAPPLESFIRGCCGGYKRCESFCGRDVV